jgi:hypothetical protein
MVSPWNKQFILHDSNGFESGDLVNFEIVREFILHDQIREFLRRTESMVYGVSVSRILRVCLSPLSGFALRHLRLEVVYSRKETSC